MSVMLVTAKRDNFLSTAAFSSEYHPTLAPYCTPEEYHASVARINNAIRVTKNVRLVLLGGIALLALAIILFFVGTGVLFLIALVGGIVACVFGATKSNKRREFTAAVWREHLLYQTRNPQLTWTAVGLKMPVFELGLLPPVTVLQPNQLGFGVTVAPEQGYAIGQAYASPQHTYVNVPIATPYSQPQPISPYGQQQGGYASPPSSGQFQQPNQYQHPGAYPGHYQSDTSFQSVPSPQGYGASEPPSQHQQASAPMGYAPPNQQLNQSLL